MGFKDKHERKDDMKRIAYVTAFVLCAAMCISVCAQPFCLDLSGEWDCAGTNFTGKAHLPGTLADAGLGTLQTPAHFAAYTERTAKTGLARRYKYYGTAVYSRTISLSSICCILLRKRVIKSVSICSLPELLQIY